jgi:hypothetical protein
MPWVCVSCKHHRHAKLQEETQAEHELKEASEEIRILEAQKVNESIMKQNNSDNRFKLKSLKPRCCRLSAGDVGIEMGNRISIPETDALENNQRNQNLQKYEYEDKKNKVNYRENR